MATNITPIEALEKVKEYCAKTKTIEWFDYDNIEGIIDQALAPQECDNCTLNNICNSSPQERCKKITEMSDEIQNQGITIADLEICKDQRDNLINQLHSQQKTFTLEEVREIIKKEYEKIDKPFVGIFYGDGARATLDSLLVEFEKENKL